MENEIETQTNEDVGTTEESSSPLQEQAGTEQTAAGEAKPEPAKETPFHEHPRFKELVEQKNKYEQQSQATTRELQEMRRMVEQLSKPKEAAGDSELVQTLRKAGVDDKFIDFCKSQEKLQKEFQDMNQWRQNQSAETTRERVSQSFNQLCSDNKITPEWRAVYEAEVRNIATQNPNLTPDDLPKVFQQVHDAQQKRMEAYKRTILGEYAKDKTKSSKQPAPQRGATAPKATGAKANEGKAIDADELKSQMVKRVLELRRAERNS